MSYIKEIAEAVYNRFIITAIIIIKVWFELSFLVGFPRVHEFTSFASIIKTENIENIIGHVI